MSVQVNYSEWPKLTDLCATEPSNGLMEKRRGALFSIDRALLSDRMQQYFDADITWEEFSRTGHGLSKDAAGFNAREIRARSIKSGRYSDVSLKPYMVRPFDQQWCYYTTINPIWNRSRPVLSEQAWDGNFFLISRFKKSKDPEGNVFFFVNCLIDDHFLSPDAVAFPIWLKEKQYAADPLFAHLATEIVRANLSVMARSYLQELGFEEPDGNAEVAGLLWYHALAIGYSIAYQTENADGIGQDFPRIPLPADRTVLGQSAQIGRQVAALLLPEQDVTGVTNQLLPYQKSIAAITFRTTDHDLSVRGNWGYRTDDNKVMPGGGRFEPRNYSPVEQQAFADSGFDEATVAILFGTTTYDVYLNENTLLVNVPARVWQFVIGGYQIMKKWLSYREESVLGRALTKEEVRELVNTARRLTGLLALEPTLNANYQEVKEKTSQTQSITTP